MKKIGLIALAVVILIAAGTTWHYFYGPCGVAPVQKANEEIRDMIGQWIDAEAIASSTPRMALAVQIQTLQDIRRESAAMEVPACMQNAKDAFVKAEQAAIDGYVAFLGQKEDSVVSVYFDTATKQMRNLTVELELISACAPYCP